jgi:glycosyltransferase involved in cell wall biosynthesis
VHQGYELYGSDRAFVDAVAAIRAAWPAADIEVLLARDGPIVAPLHASATRITFEPLLVLRRRQLGRLAVFGWLRLLPALWRAAGNYRTADLVYINTVVVLDYLIMARLFSSKTLVHVHEGPTGIVRSLLRALLRWTRAEIIFNSKTSKAVFALPPTQRQHVVYNSFPPPPVVGSDHYDGSRPLKVLMLGRLSWSKGQDLLIEALGKLPKATASKLQVRIVGGAFESDGSLEAELVRRAHAAGLDGIVRFEGFRAQPDELYRWADIVVVPSRLPETLGRSALEAMAWGRPPLAAGHGGILEVVVDGETGWLIAPNDSEALKGAIIDIVERPGDWRHLPAAARARAKAMFSPEVIAKQLQAIVGSRLMATRQSRAQPVSVRPVP